MGTTTSCGAPGKLRWSTLCFVSGDLIFAVEYVARDGSFVLAAQVGTAGFKMTAPAFLGGVQIAARVLGSRGMRSGPELRDSTPTRRPASLAYPGILLAKA